MCLTRGMRLVAVFLGGAAAGAHGAAGLDGVALLQVPLKQRAAVNATGGRQRWPRGLVPTRVVHPDWVAMPKPQELADQIPIPPVMKRLMKSASPGLQKKAVDWYRLGKKVQSHLVRIGAEMSFDDVAHGNLARNLAWTTPALQGPDPLAKLQQRPAPLVPRYGAPYYPPNGQQPLYGRRVAQSPPSREPEDDEGPEELYPPQILQDPAAPAPQRSFQDLPTTMLAANVRRRGGRRHASRQAREEEREIERLQDEDEAMRDYETTSRGSARAKSREWLEEMQQEGEEEDLLEDVYDADALEEADA